MVSAKTSSSSTFDASAVLPGSMSPSTATATPTARPAVVPTPPTGPEPRPRVPIARPACTHTVMDRVYGSYTCQVCLQKAPVGFVYFCQQDLVHGSLTQHPQSLPTSKTHRRRLQKGLLGGNERDWSTSTQLDILGFSKSVVKSAEAGHYTSDEIEILKSQKLNVKKVIQKALEEREILRSKTGPSPAILFDKLAALSTHRQPSQPSAQASDDSQPADRRVASAFPAKPKAKKEKLTTTAPPKPALSKAFESCEYRVCHACRPLFRDRCFASVESALLGEAQAPDTWIPQLMPVVPVSIMRTIGLKEPSGQTSKLLALRNKNALNFDVDCHDSEVEPAYIPNLENPRISVVEDPTRENKRNSASEDHISLMQIQKYASHASLSIGQHGEPDSEIDPLLAVDTKQERGQPKVKPQSSSVGFHASLAKDMQDIIERANREVRQSYSRKIGAQTRDKLTGLDGEILEKLSSLYRKNEKDVFDMDLWKALTESILLYASSTPLPGKDGADGLDREVPRVNGLGVMIDGTAVLIEDDVIGLALTEEAAENHSPDIITSI